MHSRNIDPQLLQIDLLHQTAMWINEDRQAAQKLSARQNIISGLIGRAKKTGADIDPAIMLEAKEIASEIPKLEGRAASSEDKLNNMLGLLPNALDITVPIGAGEADNVEQRVFGEPVDRALEHDAINIGLDFDAGSKLSGARFTVLRGPAAALSRALGQFMIDLHTEQHGYQEVSPPVLIRSKALFGTGQFPKFEEDVFQVGRDLYLAPTSEVMLANLAADTMFAATDLPLRMTALTDCFRREAGSAGRDTRGLIRQHQFQKVELVSIVEPDHSEDEHLRILNNAETVLHKLGLPFRRMLLCSGDTGFSARKTYDLEVWMAGARRYREISSISNCGDFQARRMQTRVRLDGGKVFAHTLNGSGVAVGRALAAVLEYYQDGNRVVIPECLTPYMRGQTEITIA